MIYGEFESLNHFVKRIIFNTLFGHESTVRYESCLSSALSRCVNLKPRYNTRQIAGVEMSN